MLQKGSNCRLKLRIIVGVAWFLQWSRASSKMDDPTRSHALSSAQGIELARASASSNLKELSFVGINHRFIHHVIGRRVVE
jgi:hypothetical protein